MDTLTTDHSAPNLRVNLCQNIAIAWMKRSEDNDAKRTKRTNYKMAGKE
jgi:hypothetical protein